VWGDAIRIHHVLHHTAGLPDYFALLTPHHADDTTPQFTSDVGGITNADVLRLLGRRAALVFPVGESYAYSNTGYVLLALLVEALSGRSFATFMQQRIFAPLGMQHTLVYDAARPIVHRLAHGYLQQNGQYHEWQYPLLTVGDGGMFSTLEDLVSWESALTTEQLVTTTSLERAFTPGKRNDGHSVDYGFGWMTNVYAGLRHVAHGGSLGAYNNYIIRFLDQPLTIVVLCNHRCVPGPRIRAHRIAEIYLGK
jgi:CubicO group peptidase (beta-lactamase class C family)